MSQEEPEIKKFKQSIISDHIYCKEFQNIFSTYWCSFREIKSTNLEVIAKPFRICRISNFLKDEYFMDELKNQLSNVKSRRNIMDLYQFEQSSDLTNVNKSNIKMLYETLQTDITSWMQHNTGIRLNGKISMSSSCYSDTDYLLCHDDNMEDRRIAYILYLSKNWLLEDGGTLDLFDTDQDGLPRNVVKSLLPEYNSLVFFEVVDTSYHQVAEVKSSVKCRWSINGWFHGPLTENYNRKQRPQSLPPPLIGPKSTEINLESWVTSNYLCSDVIKDIQSNVDNDSYTFLTNFLRIKMYERIMIDLTSQDIHWQMVGPADVRHYEIADEKTLPKPLKDFYDMFKSITTFRLLKNYTELDLVPEKENMNPKMTIELQRWSTGCYTLMYDRSTIKNDNWNTIENHSDSLSNIDHHEEKSTVVSEKVTMISISEDSQASSIGNNDKKNVSLKSEANSSMKRDHDIEENNILRYIRDKSAKTSDCPSSREILLDNLEDSTSEVDMNSNANDSSDIGDYLSDRLSSENGEDTSSEKSEGTLDVILQFHTSILPTEETIDYVDPSEPEGTIIQVPMRDNHLCLVYKTLNVHRVHKYINHYCQGYFYNLICTYYE